MCGISGVMNYPNAEAIVRKMLNSQEHRGPDAHGLHSSEDGRTSFAHNRLSILDLSVDGNQPFFSNDRKYSIVFNGEVYNYLELRQELKSIFPFRTETDTEVVLYAFLHWGEEALQKFIGMFSFVVRNEINGELFIARDRFGVKPFHYFYQNGLFLFASEIKAILATGLVMDKPNEQIWVEYFCNSLYDHSEDTFWLGIKKLLPGCFMRLSPGQAPSIQRWYSIESHIIRDERKVDDVLDELLYLLEDSINLRFRADVPVGICLSGGLDSSLLYALVQRVKGKDYPVHAFTFYTGDEKYDELPWVEQMFSGDKEFLHKCLLNSDEIPSLASKIAYHMDEPYGGIPTLGMSTVFRKAKELGITVLLDGNGIDEGWAGYDYYRKASEIDTRIGPVQGSDNQVFLKEVLQPNMLKYYRKREALDLHSDKLVNLQLRDILYAKIPRAMRFADRNSMAYSLELREPFLDHRIIELGLCQPIERKIQEGQGKFLVRQLGKKILPKNIGFAPKRSVQTPQREWFANELRAWVDGNLDELFSNSQLNWFEPKQCGGLWSRYRKGEFDNSFFIWQWINTNLLLHH